MSKRLGLTVVTATFLFGSSPSFAAGSGSTLDAVHGLVTDPRHDAPTAFANLFRQAPVGHRQPRPSDVPDGTQLSPFDSELRRLDEEIDKRLTICRGC